MEDEFLEWYKENETRFHQGHLDEKEIAYSAWLEGQKAGQHETIVMLPEIKELLDFILTKSTFRNSKDPNVKEHTICLGLKVRDRIAT